LCKEALKIALVYDEVMYLFKQTSGCPAGCCQQECCSFYVVRFMRGLGIKASKRAIISSNSKFNGDAGHPW
jgi:hypothetical protein